jgi:hypothetical protein
MELFTYEDAEKLRPCSVCGSRSYWFDGDYWQCQHCSPPPVPNVIRADLKEP